MYGFLSECRKIEENANQTYGLLARNERYPQKLRTLFLTLSHDESGHARSIDLVMQANRDDMDATKFISWEKVNEALMLSEKYLQRVQQGQVDAEESLKMAIEMEQAFVKIHIQNALYFSDSNLENLFHSLESEDQKHIDTLKETLTWWHAMRP